MKPAFLLAGLLLAGACSSPKSAPADTARATTADGIPALAQAAPNQALSEPSGTPAKPAPTAPQPVDRKIVRHATIEFKVTDFRATARRITALVGAFGGQIGAEQESRENEALRSQMTIRVPAARFDRFLDTLLHESVYTATKRITAEDVTRQYVDTDARVRSRQATEERYRQLLKQARNVKEVLEVEEQLTAIREEIDVQEAELRTLKSEVALSTVELTFYQETEATPAPEAPYLSRLGSNITSGFRLIGGFFLGLAYLLPLVALLAGLGLATRWWVRRRQ